MERIDVRLADARGFDELPGPPQPGGRSALWARIPDVLDMSAATLAILGDYVPFGIGQALGAQAGRQQPRQHAAGRPASSPPSGCCSTSAIDAIVNGFGHGVVHLWAEDGTLLASASQSTIVRFWQDATRSSHETRTRSSLAGDAAVRGARGAGDGGGLGHRPGHRAPAGRGGRHGRGRRPRRGGPGRPPPRTPPARCRHPVRRRRERPGLRARPRSPRPSSTAASTRREQRRHPALRAQPRGAASRTGSRSST